MPDCRLAIKVIPNAPRTQVVGWLGDAVKIKLHAPPVDGKANEALCLFLAEKLDLPKNAVTLATGATSRQKLIAIQGLSKEQAIERLCPSG